MSDERNVNLYLAAWAATGVFMRCYSLALQRKPVFTGEKLIVSSRRLRMSCGIDQSRSFCYTTTRRTSDS
jgi:hypothetical protein